jgi:23S rRNA-/tRNA-specific pseudouridylate synthase
MFILSDKPYVIKETKNVYFVYKPDGYTSDHSFNEINKNGKSIVNYVKNNLNIDNDLKNAKYRYGQINRLDYGTNGTIIIAKNVTTFERIQQYMQKQNKKTKKIYIALVNGKIEKPHDFITLYMQKIYTNGEYTISYDIDNKNGEPTLSEYKVWQYLYDKQTNKYYTLLMVRIYTGMTHQIRVHMKSIGHGLVNDYHYGLLNEKINDGKMFLISYLYCIKDFGCSIDYKNEPDFKFYGLEIQQKYNYLECIQYLLKKNNERMDKLKEFKKILRKINKRLNVYIKKNEQYTIVNIPSGKSNEVDKSIRQKLKNNLLDNKLHTVGIIDTSIQPKYIYSLIARRKINNFDNDNINVTAYRTLQIKNKDNFMYTYTQIIVEPKIQFISFDALIDELNKNNIYLLFDKKNGKNEIEYSVFKHFHNYELPIIDGEIIHKFWINNIIKYKYKYDTNIIFIDPKQ